MNDFPNGGRQEGMEVGVGQQWGMVRAQCGLHVGGPRP